MIYIIGMNIISFIIYGFDKLQAIRKKERIPEKILLILAGLGGCYGAFLAMVLFHHKIRKRKFQIVIPIALLIWSIFILKKGGII